MHAKVTTPQLMSSSRHSNIQVLLLSVKLRKHKISVMLCDGIVLSRLKTHLIADWVISWKSKIKQQHCTVSSRALPTSVVESNASEMGSSHSGQIWFAHQDSQGAPPHAFPAPPYTQYPTLNRGSFDRTIQSQNFARYTYTPKIRGQLCFEWKIF